MARYDYLCESRECPHYVVPFEVVREMTDLEEVICPDCKRSISRRRLSTAVGTVIHLYSFNPYFNPKTEKARAVSRRRGSFSGGKCV